MAEANVLNVGRLMAGVDFGLPQVFEGNYPARYKTQRAVGQGGISSVYLVTDTTDGSDRISKVTYLFRSPSAEKWRRSQSRALLEIKIFHAIQGMELKSGHENILKLYEWYAGSSTDPTYYSVIVCVFEKCACDLSHRFRQEIQRKLNENEARPVVRQIAEGLSFLHERKICHRDIKMENILCAHETELAPVKLCDFNMSRYISATQPPSPMSDLCGTMVYMDPQRLSGRLGHEADIQYTRKCDSWGLGIVMYELLMSEGLYAEQSQCDGENCKALVTQSDGSKVYDPKRFLGCDGCCAKNLEILCTQAFDADQTSVSDLTESCKDLLNGLLVQVDADRFSMAEALNHEWFN